jgi:hypothetical protein
MEYIIIYLIYKKTIFLNTKFKDFLHMFPFRWDIEGFVAVLKPL